MNYEEILKVIAPCGLNCGKCVAFHGGEIEGCSIRLKELLGNNFSSYADRLTSMDPVFENYRNFEELLEYFSEGRCGGCREQGCLFQSCQVKDCIKERGVDFCFQCDRFPCDKHGFPEGLKKRWLENNLQMKDSGLEDYYDRIRDKPRYP
ncbi:MAG TPA: DUF3795 domain-containing protein [Synergistales bacterium]|nr:DUF3795 domain-containing protein [Synergistales bacterium]